MTLKVQKAERNAERTFTINNLQVEFRTGEKTVYGHIGIEYVVIPEDEFVELRNKGDFTLAKRCVRKVWGIGTEDDPWSDEEQLEYAIKQPEIMAAMVRKYIEETKTKHYSRGN